MCMHSAMSDLSCYKTLQSHCLQNVGQENLTDAILSITPNHPNENKEKPFIQSLL